MLGFTRRGDGGDDEIGLAPLSDEELLAWGQELRAGTGDERPPRHRATRPLRADPFPEPLPATRSRPAPVAPPATAPRPAPPATASPPPAPATPSPAPPASASVPTSSALTRRARPGRPRGRPLVAPGDLFPARS